MRRGWLAAAGLLLGALLGAHGALARPMHMVESYPAADAIIDGRNAQYFRSITATRAC